MLGGTPNENTPYYHQSSVYAYCLRLLPTHLGLYVLLLLFSIKFGQRNYFSAARVLLGNHRLFSPSPSISSMDIYPPLQSASLHLGYLITIFYYLGESGKSELGHSGSLIHGVIPFRVSAIQHSTNNTYYISDKRFFVDAKKCQDATTTKCPTLSAEVLATCSMKVSGSPPRCIWFTRGRYFSHPSP